MNLGSSLVTHRVKRVQYVKPQEDHFLVRHYFCKHSASDVAMFGHIEVRSVPRKYTLYIYNSGLKEAIAVGENRQYLCTAKRALYRYKKLPHKEKALISGSYELKQQNYLINYER
jgi:hypothetical protein